MLIMDGHGSHTHDAFEARRRELKIIPFQLLPHTTHLCQPFDVGCFQPLKLYHTEAIDKAVRLDEEAIYSKTDFSATFQKIRQQAFTPATIKSAFKKTGLVPYFPDIVLDKIRAEIAKEKPRTRSVVPTSVSIPNEKESLLSHTPSGISEEFMATFHIFDQYIKQHIKDVAKDNPSACLSEVYSRFSKGVEAKLHFGALAED